MPEPLSLAWIAVWATVVAVVAVDVSKTKAFAWLRRGLSSQDPEPPSFGTGRQWREWDDAAWWERSDLVWHSRNWLSALVRCPWCLGHWLSIGVCLGHGIMNPAWWFVLTGASAVPQLLICGLLWLLEDERLSCD